MDGRNVAAGVLVVAVSYCICCALSFLLFRKREDLFVFRYMMSTIINAWWMSGFSTLILFERAVVVSGGVFHR